MHIKRILKFILVTFNSLLGLVLLALIAYKFFYVYNSPEDTKLVYNINVIENKSDEKVENIISVDQDINTEVSNEQKLEKEKNDVNQVPPPESKEAQEGAILPPKDNLDKERHEAKVALIFVNVGLNDSLINKILMLPSQVALGISPYALNVKEMEQKAQGAGHEIYINLPFEPENYPLEDPGSLGILRSKNVSENLDIAYHILNFAPSIKGVYTMPREVYSLNIKDNNVEPVFELISRSNLTFLYGNSRLNGDLINIANKTSLKILPMNYFLKVENIQTLRSDLTKIEEDIFSKEKVLCYIEAHPELINGILEWIETLKQKSINLVPVTLLLEE